MQLVFLMYVSLLFFISQRFWFSHDLGRVVNMIDLSTAEDSQEYDWTLLTECRVIGCAPSKRVSFKEFTFQNSDLKDSRYNTNLGMFEESCGIRNLLLTWNGPEYLVTMLKHNKVQIPDEGLSILRLFLLRDLHKYHEYSIFDKCEDEDLRQSVSDFDSFRISAKQKNFKELSDDDCDRLWKEKYLFVFEKYSCSGELDW